MEEFNLFRRGCLIPMEGFSTAFLGLVLATLLMTGCAHYPLNQPVKAIDPAGGYRMRNISVPGNSDSILMILTFSGGGTRAASLAYGVLEELARTEVEIEGRKGRLLDQVDLISSVSGGSFTAGYYGLFGEGIFLDFESKFLKKNIQGALTLRTFLNPYNWYRLSFAAFDRSDLAAEYYGRHVFEGGTFGDMKARQGPIILMNATEMTYGIRVGFTQGSFDAICSDLLQFPVARAVAASSAVPMLLSPITIRNYAGTCGYKLPERLTAALKSQDITERQFYLANNMALFIDSEKKKYIHLVDGGVSDNLGLRAVLDRVILNGSYWNAIKGTALENTHKVIFVMVNAETQPDTKWDQWESPPPFSAVLSSYSSIAIERYNEETVALLKESLKSWRGDVRTERCEGKTVSTEPGMCGDIRFYVIEVKFDALKDENERMYFKRLPTSFKLAPDQVDRLRDAANRIMVESPEFQRLLGDLRQ